MKADECENLDLALALWLTEEEQARFDAHLTDCALCRQAMAEQREIDRLLRQAVDRLEPAPPELVARIGCELEPVALPQSKTLLWRAGWAAAATVAIIISGWFLSGYFSGQADFRPVAKNGVTTQKEVRARIKPQAKVTWHDPEDVILVPIETDLPNVTIVWVYPTIKPEEDDTENDEAEEDEPEEEESARDSRETSTFT